MAKVIAFRRTGAVTVSLFNGSIHFKPDEQGRVSAEVTDPRALARFKEIPTDYRVEEHAAEPEPAKASSKAKTKAAEEAATEAKAG